MPERTGILDRETAVAQAKPVVWQRDHLVPPVIGATVLHQIEHAYDEPRQARRVALASRKEEPRNRAHRVLCRHIELSVAA